MENRKDANSLSRREFLGTTGKTAAAFGLGMAAMPYHILPVHAEPIARRARMGANDQVVLGLIGCGGMGAFNMRQLMGKQGVQVAALCDVDDSRMGGDI